MLYIFFCLIPSGAESAPVQSLYFTGFSVSLAETALQVQGAAAVGYLGLDKIRAASAELEMAGSSIGETVSVRCLQHHLDPGFVSQAPYIHIIGIHSAFYGKLPAAGPGSHGPRRLSCFGHGIACEG